MAWDRPAVGVRYSARQENHLTGRDAYFLLGALKDVFALERVVELVLVVVNV